MTDEPEILSRRAAERRASRNRREVRAALAQAAFEAIAGGWSPEQIAETRGVDVRTVRREVDRALARRRLDAPERYAHFQVSRLNKALHVADAALDRGDLRAVEPMTRVVAALDRYHGLKGGLPAPGPAPAALAAPVAPAEAPLALSHARAPDLAAADAIGAGDGTDGE